MSVQGEASCFRFYEDDSQGLFLTGCRWIRQAKLGDVIAYNIRINYHGEVAYRPTRAFVYAITDRHYKLKIYKRPNSNEIKYFSVSKRRIYNAKDSTNSFMLLFSHTYDSSVHSPPFWYSSSNNIITIDQPIHLQTPSDKKIISSQEALSIIDDIKEHLNDGQYLQLCNYFKEMHEKE